MGQRRSLIGWFTALVWGPAAAPRPIAAIAATPTCSETPARSAANGPPRLVLRAPSGACQQAGRLGYCWSCGAYAACTDGGGGVSSGGRLELAAGETAEIRAGHLGRVARLDLAIWVGSSPATGPPPFPPEESRPVRRERRHRPAEPILLTTDLPPGPYTIDVHVRVRGDCGGDTSQWFTILVRDAAGPATPGATPAASATPVPA